MRAFQFIAIAVSLAACVDPDDGDQLDDNTAELSVTGEYSWTTSSNSSADIGTAVNRACYLTAVGGYLTTQAGSTLSNDTSVGVRINPTTNHWEIFGSPAQALPVHVRARCVNGVTPTAAQTWSNYTGSVVLAPVTATRRCFFTSVGTGRDGFYWSGGFDSTLDAVIINNNGTNWVIEGSATKLVRATASCIDVATDLGQYLAWANPGNTMSTPMSGSSGGTAACFLTQIAGNMSSTDSAQGPSVTYTPLLDRYNMNGKNGTGGRARCVK